MCSFYKLEADFKRLKSDNRICIADIDNTRKRKKDIENQEKIFFGTSDYIGNL